MQNKHSKFFFDKGFPKGGGVRRFGKNSQIISFFLSENVPNLDRGHHALPPVAAEAGGESLPSEDPGRAGSKVSTPEGG